MAEFTDVAATPSPVSRLYDAERNKQWGVATLEDVQAEFLGRQEALAARIRLDKNGRHRRSWNDLIERASEGMRLKVLKQSLEGTKQSTETMVRLTGYSAVTTQQRILLADFLVWAAPELRLLWEQSLIEREAGTGVRDFVMPPDQNIIERGRAAAKKAGCWGPTQVLMIGDAGPIVGVADLPRNIDWKPGRTPTHPWWEKKGALVQPWDDYVLYAEVHEAGRELDLQPAWSLDLCGAAATLRGRAFVARSVDGTLASAGASLDQFAPHVHFLSAEKADLPGADNTGKQHRTLNDIAVDLSVAPNIMAERLRDRGYLNLKGESTPAALDAGITRIVDGGTQFCSDPIRSLLEEWNTEGMIALDETDEQDLKTGEVHNTDPAADLAATDASADIGVVSETEEAAEAANTMDRATDDELDQAVNEPASRPVSDVADTHAIGIQALEKTESGLAALLAAEMALGRRTEGGGFAPHPGDNQTLRNRIKTAALAMSAAGAALTNLAAMYKALRESDDTSTKKAQRLEAENTELKHRIQEMQTTIEGLEPRTEAHAEILPFKALPGAEGDAATAASH